MLVRYSCELETYIVAVERIKEYCEVPKEVSMSYIRDGVVMITDIHDYRGKKLKMIIVSIKIKKTGLS